MSAVGGRAAAGIGAHNPDAAALHIADSCVVLVALGLITTRGASVRCVEAKAVGPTIIHPGGHCLVGVVVLVVPL